MQPVTMIPDDDVIPGIQHPPKICVDYLSHEWKKEDDIWTSWKFMSKQKKALANGIRLENASWRSWAKQKYKLKTVNPEKLNWLKDSDVTWLYGPLHTAWSNKNETSPKSPYSDDMPSTKSCLKKKSLSEILRPMVRGKYGSLVTSNSDTQLYKKDRDSDADSSDCETASTCSSISAPSTPTTGPTESILLPTEDGSHQNRKIQFNDRVEQCIAVDSDEDDESSDSSDGGIIMRISSKKRDCSTICKLAPTKLKEDRINNNEYSSLYSNNKRRPSNLSSKPPSTATPTSSSSTTTPQPHQPWMDDDDDDIDIDLFDFEPPRQSTNPIPHYHSGGIIPQPNAFTENQHPQDDDYDSIVERAVDKFVHWVFRF